MVEGRVVDLPEEIQPLATGEFDADRLAAATADADGLPRPLPAEAPAADTARAAAETRADDEAAPDDEAPPPDGPGRCGRRGPRRPAILRRCPIDCPRPAPRTSASSRSASVT